MLADPLEAAVRIHGIVVNDVARLLGRLERTDPLYGSQAKAYYS